MPLGQRPSRRPGYKYDRTDLLLLGGGALLVVFGLILALNAWLDPAARSGVTRRFAMLKPDSVARDSAGARLRGAAGTDSAAAVSTGTSAPAADSAAAAPVPGAPVVAAPDSARPADSAMRGPVAAARVTPAPAPSTTPPPSTSPAPATTPKTATARAPAPAGSSATATNAATGFTLQVGAFGQRANADKLATAIGNLGFHADVIDPVTGAGTLHRVRVTGFATRELAEAARDSIGRSLGERATVTAARQP